MVNECSKVSNAEVVKKRTFKGQLFIYSNTGNYRQHNSKKEFNQLGITELKLNNGVVVVLKPVDTAEQNNGLIKINALAGISKHSFTESNKSEFFAAAEIIKNGGANGYNRFDLQESLKGTGIHVDPYIYLNMQKGMRGVCKTGASEQLLQLMYSFFVAPFADQTVFDDWYSRKKRAEVKDMYSRSAFEDTIGAYLGNTMSFINYLSPGELKKISLRGALKAYRKAFGNAAEFTFVVSGDFDTAILIPQLVRYFGALPANKRLDKMNSSPVKYNDKVFKKIVYEGVDPDKASVGIYFRDSMHYSTQKGILLKILNSILHDAIDDRLRRKEGGVYFVLTNIREFSRGEYYEGNIKFDCSKNDLDRLINAAVETMKGLRLNPRLEHYFSQALLLEKSLLNYRDVAGQTEYWLNYISYCISYGRSYNELVEKRRLIEHISIEDLKIAIDEFLQPEKMMLFIRLPVSEKKNTSRQAKVQALPQ